MNESSALYTRTPIHGFHLRNMKRCSTPRSSRIRFGSRRLLRSPTMSSDSLTTEYGVPVRQSRMPSRSQVGVGSRYPRPNNRFGTSPAATPYVFGEMTGHIIVSRNDDSAFASLRAIDRAYEMFKSALDVHLKCAPADISRYCERPSADNVQRPRPSCCAVSTISSCDPRRSSRPTLNDHRGLKR